MDEIRSVKVEIRTVIQKIRPEAKEIRFYPEIFKKKSARHKRTPLTLP